MQFGRARVGAVAYATDIVDSFFLNKYQNKEGVINALNFYNKVSHFWYYFRSLVLMQMPKMYPQMFSFWATLLLGQDSIVFVGLEGLRS